MIKRIVLTACVAALALSYSAPAFAGAKSYQVTGPVLEKTADMIAVQKGKDRWEINMGSASVPPDVKVGDKVTVMYTMTATSVEAKAGKAAGAKKGKKGKM